MKQKSPIKSPIRENQRGGDCLDDLFPHKDRAAGEFSSRTCLQWASLSHHLTVFHKGEEEMPLTVCK